MKKMNRFGFALLAGIMSASMLASSAFAAPLQPVKHEDWMVKKQWIAPDKQGSLALERNVTLAEVAVVLSKVKGADIKPATVGNWALPYLNWAKEKGALTEADVKSTNQSVTGDKLAAIGKAFGYEMHVSGAKALTRGEFFQALGDAVTTHFTIAHTNDVHGHISEDEGQKEYGYAKMATLIKEWRDENKNFLLMDAGDTFQGTVFVNQFKGETVVPILNQLGYTAMAAGNHDFDFGFEQLLKLRDSLKYPVINANVFKADGSNLLVPTFQTEIGGQKFAFIGFVTEETPILTHPDNVKGLTIKSPVEVAKLLVPELKKAVDHVIVVSHVGIDVDREIAKNVPGIDLIVGGHSHTPLRTPENVNGTYIVQDWEYGKSLGRADLYYLDKELVTFSGGLAEYDKNVQADPEVDKLVKEVVKKVDESMNEVIGKTEVNLDGDRELVRAKETNIGDFIADTMLARTKTIAGHEADVALTNGGGIRSSIKAGNISKKDLYTVLPFPNTLVIVEATGAELKQALENGVSQIDQGAGRFPQIAGMSFSYDRSKPAGQRVVEVKVGGQPLDEKKTYKVATNDFIAVGGDGYESLNKPSFNTGFTLYNVVEEEIIKQKTLNPKVDNRIVEVKK